MSGSGRKRMGLQILGSGTLPVATASRGGRPSKITPDVTRRICAALSASTIRKDAALIGGVSYETLRRWMHKGEGEALKAIEGVLDPDTAPAGGAYAFYMAVLQAEASTSIRLSMTLYKAALNDPRYALLWLERRRRTDWGQRINIRDVPTDLLIEVLEGQLEAEALSSI